MNSSRYKAISFVLAALFVAYSLDFFEPKKKKATVPKTSTSQVGRQGTASKPLTKLETMLNTWDPTESFTVDANPNLGAIVVNNGSFLIRRADEKRFLSELVQALDLFNADFEKLNTSSQATSSNEVSGYQQMYKGFPIENNIVKLFRRLDDGRVFYITATLTTLTELNEKIKFPRDQAAKLALKSFEPGRRAKISTVHPKPVVLNEVTPKLVWKMVISLENPIEQRLLYVSAQTGVSYLQPPH